MKNVLFLCSHDSELTGHAKYVYNLIPPDINKKIVTYTSLKAKEQYAFYYSKSFIFRVVRKLKYYMFFLKRWIEFGEPVRINNDHGEYCFYHHDDCCMSAKAILKKCKGFKPDLIAVYWVADFVSPKTIRDLYMMTKAQILIVFVDEAPLAGGCHFHCDCDNYLIDCKSCPALISGKKLAEKQMQNRKKYLNGLPIIINGTPYDIEKAKNTDTYSDCKYLEWIHLPKATIYNKEESRKKYEINNEEFVIFIGASNLKDPRKGVKYSLDAINLFAKFHPNITLLFLGRKPESSLIDKRIKVISPGFLSYDGMCEAMCASDVFVSSTIADSGPMTVNIAFALGLPTISFDIGIAHTLIIHKDTGYIAKYKNVESIKEGLIYISSLSKEDWKAMNERCIKRINNLHTPDWWYILLRNQCSE